MLSRLEATFQQQAQFTADASHELRTPLTVMRGNTSLALVGERTAEEYKQTLERMHRSVTTMSVLVDELLLLSRADSRQILSTPENVQIREVVSAAIDQVNGNDDTRLSIHIPTADITVSGNLNLLARVFVNLLNNAMQHTEPSDTIELRIRISGTNVEIEIEDTGEGIKPEHVAHIMERFFRSDSSRSKYQGTGLGLAITRSIVQAHHGTIVVRSRYGIGTTVTVQLPLVARIA
jgi:signal transduction histidine kinase